MGSLGSTSVNEKLLDFLRTYEREDSEILFITGKTSYNDLSNNLIVPKSTKIVPFFDNLPSLMKSADLIISRAGASTIAEIMATKTPSILIPSPYVANNHQYYNALDLVNKKISYLIEEKDLNKNTLIEAIDYMFDPKTEKEVKDNLKQVKDISSSTMILDEVKKMIKGKNAKESKEEV
jgi:UDP-N-acetylglucosamine--N-acetylmuramyl-(pentapeptide) pyrophosphoryl-undecaprenol N-acetylglucosamine transferase